MAKKIAVLLLVGLAAAWMALSCDDGGDGDGDADVDGDGDADSDGDGDSNWMCDQASTDVPTFRLTSLAIESPAALANPMLQSIINTSVDEYRFLWLVEFDVAGGTITTGSGTAQATPPTTDAQRCNVVWNEDYTPATANITVTGDTVETQDPITEIEIPIYGSTDPENPMMTLPLRLVEFTATMSADRVLIGTPPAAGTTYARDWNWGECTAGGECNADSDCSGGTCETLGHLSGWISVEAAREAVIEQLGSTLCGLLSGDQGGAGPEDDCSSPQGEWDNQPDTIPGTSEPGYAMAANLGAGALTIGQ